MPNFSLSKYCQLHIDDKGSFFIKDVEAGDLIKLEIDQYRFLKKFNQPSDLPSILVDYPASDSADLL